VPTTVQLASLVFWVTGYEWINGSASIPNIISISYSPEAYFNYEPILTFYMPGSFIVGVEQTLRIYYSYTYT
jgi:hypothetical protein